MKPKYKNKRFKGRDSFDKWLKRTTKYTLHFEDKGQDFLTWYVDERGEVLHSDLQTLVWNGKMLDLESLKKNTKPIFLNNEGFAEGELKYKIVKLEVV
jgi:photosystem II stability/assembly factor-like uncharacterized protein